MNQFTNKFFMLLLAATLFFIPNKVSAWGKKGHSLTAQIALHYLDSDTKNKVLKYLGGMSFEEAASWMDELRSKKEYDFMKPFHYINIEKNEIYEENEKDNIVNELNKTIKQLKNIEDLSNESIKFNLLKIFHLVGDLGQPLHVGYGEDKGGNTIQVSFFGNGSNIHSVWDTKIIEYQKISIEDCLKHANFSKKEMRKLRRINVEKWMQHSRSLLNNVYDIKSNKVETEYIKANQSIIEKQLLISGIRLASVLKKLFKNFNNEQSI